MKVIFRNYNIIEWSAPCNSSIHGREAFREPHKLLETSTDDIGGVIPCTGDKVKIPSDVKEYKVINRRIDLGVGEIAVELSNNVIEVDYYDYMKAFTHICDNMKSSNDPTKIDIGDKEMTVELPTTLSGWLTDIATLAMYSSLVTSEQISLGTRRCKVKPKG